MSIVAICATLNCGTEGARTQRTLARGTAKRLAHKHVKPRPRGAASDGCVRAGKIRGFLASPQPKLQNDFVNLSSLHDCQLSSVLDGVGIAESYRLKQALFPGDKPELQFQPLISANPR